MRSRFLRTRLTGLTGAFSIGALNIQQREKGASPSTNFTAIRLRRDVLANSDVGVMLLNKDVAGSAYNRALVRMPTSDSFAI